MTPRWYQSESVDATWLALSQRRGNPLIIAPCGAGKSVIIAMLCRDAVQRWGGRAIVLAHRQELLSQNHAKIKALLPDMAIGINSAALRQRDTNDDVIVAGIASVFRKAHEFGERNLIIIDEAHLIGDDGMYQKFIADMRQICPAVKIIGLTATPFRLDNGPIVGADKLFQTIAYSIPLARLINEGYLCRLTTEAAINTQDASGLHKRQGEFVANELATLFDDTAKVKSACAELVEKSTGRRSVLVFCVSVAHAEHVRDELERITGDRVGLVTGESLPIERTTQLRDFCSGVLRIMVSIDCLSVGFDYPGIDCIGVLRATASACWWAQAIGRGLRISPAKTDCLIVDFGGNAERHGPIDAADYGMKSKPKKEIAGDAPTRTCPNCQTLLHAAARECECGFVFPKPQLRHEANATGGAIMQADVVETEWIVESCHWRRHQKKKPDGNPNTLCLTYVCTLADSPGGNLSKKDISEWVCIEHDGFAGKKAVRWWRERSNTAPPTTIDEALELLDRGAVAMPTHIATVPDGHFTKIVRHDLDEKPETWQDVVDDFEFASVGNEQDVPF